MPIYRKFFRVFFLFLCLMSVAGLQAQQLEISPANPTIAVHEQVQLHAILYDYTTGEMKDLTNSALWFSQFSEVASVSGSGLVTGNGTSKYLDSTKISAQIGPYQVITTVKVVPAPPPKDSFAITPENPEVVVGNIILFKAKDKATGESVELTPDQWFSLKADLTAVFSNSVPGLAIVLEEGTTPIRAEKQNNYGETTLTALPGPSPKESISITPENPEAVLNDTIQFQATDKATGESLKPYKWLSSDPQIVWISELGVATAKASGEAAIGAVKLEGQTVTDYGFTTMRVSELFKDKPEKKAEPSAILSTRDFDAVQRADKPKTQMNNVDENEDPEMEVVLL